MLLSLSFAPFGWWPLAILMPAVLIWLWEGATPRRAAVLGFWFNAGTFSVGTYWLYIAIKQIGARAARAGAVPHGGPRRHHGRLPRLARLGWSRSTCRERGAMRWLVGIPGAWLLIEWWRSWFLTRLRLAGAGLRAHRQLVRRSRARDRAVRPGPAHAGAGRRVWSRCCSATGARASPAGALYLVDLGRGVRAARHRVDRALQPPDHRRRGAGRDSAGREMDRATISNPSSSCTRRARARRTAPHSSSGPSRRSRTWLTTTSSSIAMCTRRRVRMARR